MKKLFTILAVVVITTSLFAQAPYRMSYQAVIRNASNHLVTSTTVGMRISILHGSPTGSVVYVETHTPTTNSNGLATIEIGSGTILTGSFGYINWENGPFFVKSETDLEGGTNYTITNISQLMSVSYALYANTAENLTIGFTETDPTFGPTAASGITSTNISNWSTSYSWGNHAVLYRSISYIPAWNEITGKPIFTTIATSGSFNDLLSNPFLFTTPTTDQLVKYDGTNWVNFTPDFSLSNHSHSDANTTLSGYIIGTDKVKLNSLQTANGTETIVTAGTNITNTGTGTIASPYVINNTGATTHHVGDLYGGGIVVAVWKEAGVEHGLIVSLVDISTSATWSNVTSPLIGVTAQSPIDGRANTNAIIGQAGHTASAAKLCVDYNGGGFTDWYLPALWELKFCYKAAYLVNTLVGNANGFQYGWNSGEGEYWSSTESPTSNPAWVLGIGSGYSFTYCKYAVCRVRAVRRY
ncbi:MAG: hypothetical protein WCR42_06785 [bacterium]